MDISEFTKEIGIQHCLEINPEVLVPEARVHSYCRENKCGNFGQSYMCPPHTGTLNEINIKLRKFSQGILLQYTVNVDVKHDWPGIRQSMVDFHHKILEAEVFLKTTGINDLWGITAGTCGLCEVCAAKSAKPCVYPDQARASMEALGIDVISLLDNLGLANQFYNDKITWTGCILFNTISS